MPFSRPPYIYLPWQDLYETIADANRRVHCFRTIKMLYELYLREVNIAHLRQSRPDLRQSRPDLRQSRPHLRQSRPFKTVKASFRTIKMLYELYLREVNTGVPYSLPSP